jgi:hypothetical protein
MLETKTDLRLFDVSSWLQKNRSTKQTKRLNQWQIVRTKRTLADKIGTPSEADIIMSESNHLDLTSTAFIPLVIKGRASSSLNIILSVKDSDSDGPYIPLFKSNYLQRCMEAFSQYFYDAHPFLPPRPQLLQAFKAKPIAHLRTAMCYVGSRYISGSSPTSLALEFDSHLSGTSAAAKDASMVQAMRSTHLTLTPRTIRKELLRF